MHPLAVKLLDPLGPFRPLVDQVAAGAVVVPRLLAFEVAKLKLIPCAERVIESPHAITNLKVGHTQVLGSAVV